MNHVLPRWAHPRFLWGVDVKKVAEMSRGRSCGHTATPVPLFIRFSLQDHQGSGRVPSSTCIARFSGVLSKTRAGFLELTGFDCGGRWKFHGSRGLLPIASFATGHAGLTHICLPNKESTITNFWTLAWQGGWWPQCGPPGQTPGCPF